MAGNDSQQEDPPTMNLLDIMLRGTTSTSILLRWQPHLLTALALWIASLAGLATERYLQVFALAGIQGPVALAGFADMAGPLAWAGAGITAYAFIVGMLTRRAALRLIPRES